MGTCTSDVRDVYVGRDSPDDKEILLQVQFILLLSDFNKKLNVFTTFTKSPQYRISGKSIQS